MAKSSKDKPVKKSAPKAAEEKAEKPSPKSKKKIEDEDGDDDEDFEDEPKAKASSRKKEDDDDDDDDVEVEDDWEKVEEEENWDPDFDEFDIPKSKSKKGPATPKKSGRGGEDDLGMDDEFKDMDLFNDSGGYDDEEDDYWVSLMIKLGK